MLDIERQISSGLLVCPKTHELLAVKGNFLITQNSQHTYPYINRVPILIDPDVQAAYLAENAESMVREYSSQITETSEPTSVFSFLQRPLRAVQQFVLNPGED
jgi:uncharacterized protein YbaR (Trm112 family)